MASANQISAQIAAYKAGSCSRELANLAKLYTDEIKYTSVGDSFDYKFKIFLDHCKQAGIPRDSLISAMSMILKGQALDYFFTCKFRSQGNWSIEEIGIAIKAYFEGPEHQINSLQKWNGISI